MSELTKKQRIDAVDAVHKMLDMTGSTADVAWMVSMVISTAKGRILVRTAGDGPKSEIAATMKRRAPSVDGLLRTVTERGLEIVNDAIDRSAERDAAQESASKIASDDIKRASSVN